jgi:hypothetical protein
MWEFGRASDDEALKLIVAFFQIHEPERRQQVLALAKRFERQSVRPARLPPDVRQDN